MASNLTEFFFEDHVQQYGMYSTDQEEVVFLYVFPQEGGAIEPTDRNRRSTKRILLQSIILKASHFSGGGGSETTLDHSGQGQGGYLSPDEKGVVGPMYSKGVMELTWLADTKVPRGCQARDLRRTFLSKHTILW